MSARVLIVDDEPLKRITLQIELAEAGYDVCDAPDAVAARRIFDGRPFDVVVSDVRLPGVDGMELLAHVKRTRPETTVILMTAYATVDTAVRAIKLGAHDYIAKPFTTAELISKLDQLQMAHGVERETTCLATQFCGMTARSRMMAALFSQIRAVAPTQRTVLVTGERGAGKELVAAAIHASSPRRDQPFARVSCGSTSAATLEQELFGWGAQPGARPVRLEQARGGTMLLDDVDELTATSQLALLRMLEQQEFDRGGGAPGADVRFICLSRRDLGSLVIEGRFRADLHDRLRVIQLHVPALRDRPEDIPVLVAAFLDKHRALSGGRLASISAHALEELVRHRWPGNVRELEHTIERGLALAGGAELRPEHVLPLVSEPRQTGPDEPNLELASAAPLGLTETVADIERRLILMALRQCNGNQARAAQRLGIPRTTLRDKMARYSIPA